jgi:integrase/recombinase XerD
MAVPSVHFFTNSYGIIAQQRSAGREARAKNSPILERPMTSIQASEGPTIAGAAARWASHQRSRRRPLAARTIEAYDDAWRSFAAWLARDERTLVAQIGVHDLRDWLDSMRGYADNTVQAYCHGALAICRWLADRGELRCDLTLLRSHARDALPRATADRAPDVPDLRRLVGFYDAELPQGEPGTLLERERLNGLRNAALLHMLFSTGARISEVLALDVPGIRGDGGSVAARVRIVGKGGKPRTTFVRPHAQRALERYLALRRVSGPGGAPLEPNGPLFISHGPRGIGQRLHRTTAWKIVTAAANGLAQRLEAEGRRGEAARLRAATPHTFRHFVAMWLLNEGAQMSEVSALLGHANTRITEQYYARHTDDRLEELHDQFAPDPEG